MDYPTELAKLEALINQRALSDSFNIFTESKRLKMFLSQYKRTPSDPYAKGRYLGVLFEYYVTILLIQAVATHPSVKWLVPTVYHSRILKQKQRQNRLVYNPEGEILLLDGKFPTAEFDGLLKLGKKVFLLETKVTMDSSTKTAQKLYSRLRLFHAAYHVTPELIIIVPKTSTRINPSEILLNHPQIHFFKVENWKGFQKAFEKKRKKLHKGKLTPYSQKLRAPHQVFPHSIPFKKTRIQLIKAFNQIMDGKLTVEEFFSANQRQIDLIGRIPLGVLDPKGNYSAIDSINAVIQTHLKQNFPCVLFLKLREPTARPEVIFKTELTKNPNQKFIRSSYDPSIQHFSPGRKKVTKGSITFQLTNQIAEKKGVPKISFDSLQRIIIQCNELTACWERHSLFKQLYNREDAYVENNKETT